MMNRQLALLISLIAATFTISTLAAEKYVTDDLPVYLRRGPGEQYALNGSLKAGDKVTILAVSQDGRYTQVVGPKGRTAWIQSSLLRNSPSVRARLPELEAQVTTLQQSLSEKESSQQTLFSDLKQQLASAQHNIEQLTQTNQALQQQIQSQQSKISSINNQLDEKRQSLMRKWFLYGAAVAGGSFLFGLILPSIMPRRRRKNDRWMS